MKIDMSKARGVMSDFQKPAEKLMQSEKFNMGVFSDFAVKATMAAGAVLTSMAALSADPPDLTVAGVTILAASVGVAKWISEKMFGFDSLKGAGAERAQTSFLVKDEPEIDVGAFAMR